jgi:hypothetical protein
MRVPALPQNTLKCCFGLKLGPHRSLFEGRQGSFWNAQFSSLVHLQPPPHVVKKLLSAALVLRF